MHALSLAIVDAEQWVGLIFSTRRRRTFVEAVVAHTGSVFTTSLGPTQRAIIATPPPAAGVLQGACG